MQAQFNIPKAAKNFTIDAAKLPREIQDRLLYFGLKRKLDNVLADVALDKWQAEEGNSSKTKAQFEVHCAELIQNQIDKLWANDWREGGGGGPKIEALLKEAVACLARSYQWPDKVAKTFKSWELLEKFLFGKAEEKFKADGGKYAKQNVEYMAEKMLDRVKAKAQANLEDANFDVPINEAK